MRVSLISGLVMMTISFFTLPLLQWLMDWWLVVALCLAGLSVLLFVRIQPPEVSPWEETQETIEDLLREQMIDYSRVWVDDTNPNLIRFMIRCGASGVAAFEERILGMLSAFRMRLGNALLEVKPDYDKGAMVISMPRPDHLRRKVALADAFTAVSKSKVRLPVCLGMTGNGQYPVKDLTTIPHLLIAGTTGSGKSVFLLNMLVTWLHERKPQLILISPKPTTFAAFQDVATVIKDAREAVEALQSMVIEMHRRYTEGGTFGEIVIVIDELAQLMVSSDKKLKGATELCLVQLAQMAREAGIHLVLATQRPSSEVLTGLIRDNIPGRICLKVATPAASRMILGEQHGDGYKLRGNGHGYWLNGEQLVEFQSPMVTEQDVREAIRAAKQRTTTLPKRMRVAA